MMTQREAWFVIDDRQRITGWSQAAILALGVPETDAVGRSCHEIVRGYSSFGQEVCQNDCSALQVLQSGELTARCVLMLAKDGEPRRRFVADLVALPDDSGGALAVLVEQEKGRATTTGSQASPEPDTAKESALDVVHNLTSLATLASSLSPDYLEKSIDRTLDWLRNEVEAEAAELFLVEPQGKDVLLSAYRGPFKTAFSEMTRFQPGEGFPGLVSIDRRPILTRDLPQDPRYLRTRVIKKGFNSYACVPLMGADGVMGILNVASRRSDMDLKRTLRILTWASLPVSNMLRAGIMEMREQIESDLVDSPRDAENSLNRLMRTVLSQMVAVGQSAGGALLLYDNGVEGVVRRVTVGEFSSVLCPDISAGSPQNCPALEGNHGIALFGPRRLWPSACHQVPGGAAMVYCLPLVAAGQEVGIVQLGYSGSVPSPPTKYLPVLLSLAERAARVMKQAWMNLQTQQMVPSGLVALGASTKPVTATNGRHFSGRGQKPSNADIPAANSYMHVRCFGTFELYLGGRLVTPDMFNRRGALTLLKILLMKEGRPMSRDALAELLWPGADPQAAANRLYVLVHALRRVVEPTPRGKSWLYIRSDGDHYYFNREAPCSLDVEEFRESVALGNQFERERADEDAIRSYEEAMTLYRGDLLEEEPYADWCWADREHLREICIAVLNKLATHYLKQDSPEESINHYRRALQIDPLREQSHRGLMRALWLAGRRDEALRQYLVCKALLQRELGLDPLPESERLYSRIRGD